MSFLVVFKRIYSSHCINFCYLCCVFKVIQSFSHSKLSSFTSTGSEFLKDFLIQNKCFFNENEHFKGNGASCGLILLISGEVHFIPCADGHS